MTKRNKVIVGVVVVLGALYLYDRSRKMKAKEDLKAGADVQPETLEIPSGTGGVKSAPIQTIKPMTAQYYK